MSGIAAPLGVPSAPSAGPGNAGTISDQPVTDFDRGPLLVNEVKAKVPVGASGMVRVQVTIASDGSVTRAVLIDDTPYKTEILEAAELCRFRPARRRGRAVAVNWVLQFNLATDR